MYGVVHVRTFAEMLHDVNLSAMRPVHGFGGLGKHPDGWPIALRHIKLGAYLNPAETKFFLVFAPNAASEILRLVLGENVVHHASQHKVTVFKTIQPLIRGHMGCPTSIASWNLRPNRLVQSSRIEFIVPHQGITAVLLGRRNPKTSDEKQQNDK